MAGPANISGTPNTQLPEGQLDVMVSPIQADSPYREEAPSDTAMSSCPISNATQNQLPTDNFPDQPGVSVASDIADSLYSEEAGHEPHTPSCSSNRLEAAEANARGRSPYRDDTSGLQSTSNRPHAQLNEPPDQQNPHVGDKYTQGPSPYRDDAPGTSSTSGAQQVHDLTTPFNQQQQQFDDDAQYSSEDDGERFLYRDSGDESAEQPPHSDQASGDEITSNMDSPITYMTKDRPKTIPMHKPVYNYLERIAFDMPSPLPDINQSESEDEKVNTNEQKTQDDQKHDNMDNNKEEDEIPVNTKYDN